MEVLDLDIGNLDDPVSLDMPSSSAGVGLELLMNDKQKSVSIGNSHLGELDTLENELKVHSIRFLKYPTHLNESFQY